ncbi:uncharacterized protein [Montipora foliosa]|uniref:uncharacterized protein isoform X2 n=1 Tax=Montipora foliosa TaxID=591990 RepID=UPI0035F20BF2
MSVVIWVKYLTSMVFLCPVFTCQRADGLIAPPLMTTQTDYGCIWFDESGAYDLTSLERRDGKPRFTVVWKNYNVSYNPCKEFSLGPHSADCFDSDVAICMWTYSPPWYQNIGLQRTVIVLIDSETSFTQLEYSNVHVLSVVRLRCDPTKKHPQDAVFDVIGIESNPKVFMLTHNCACPDACSKVKPTAKSVPPDVFRLTYWIPIGALSLLSIAGPLVIYICQKRQAPNDNQQQLINGGGNEVDCIINQFDDSHHAKRPINEEVSPKPPTGNSSPRCNIAVCNKDYSETFKNKTREVGSFT